jgi:hypothetical protein
MSDESLAQRVRRHIPWGQTRLGAAGTCVGVAVGLSTIVCCATNAISVQQAIAMAVPVIVGITGGLVRMLVLDSWAAWRRGFEQGCQAALAYRLHGPGQEDATISRFTGAAEPVQLVPRLGGRRCPPGATG